MSSGYSIIKLFKAPARTQVITDFEEAKSEAIVNKPDPINIQMIKQSALNPAVSKTNTDAPNSATVKLPNSLSPLRKKPSLQSHAGFSMKDLR